MTDRSVASWYPAALFAPTGAATHVKESASWSSSAVDPQPADPGVAAQGTLGRVTVNDVCPGVPSTSMVPP